VCLKIGIPKAIASDDGREFKGRFKQILEDDGIYHIIMTTHLSCIDRFTRAIKNTPFERAQHTGKYWHLLLVNVINQYNSTIHSSTKFRPVDAIKHKNAVEVKTNIMLQARFKRKYKDINIHDKVKVFKKKQKYSEMKEHVKNWTDKTYEVLGIDQSGLNGQVSYKLDGLAKLYLRNELVSKVNKMLFFI